MSKYNLYALKDVKIGFMNPFLQQSNDVAVRTLTTAVNDTQPNAVNTDKEDKELWLLGTYDDVTGEIVPETKFICRAIDVYNPEV